MKTLEDLIQVLNVEIQDKGINNALDLLSPFSNYAGNDWQVHNEFDESKFHYAVLHKDEHLKLVLIFWNSLKRSNKHGHMKGGGLMRVLSGEIIETRYHPDDTEKIIGTFSYSKGDLSYIHDALAFHTVENRTSEPAVSLHLYCNGKDSTFGFE